MDKIKVSKEVKKDLDYMLSHKDKFFVLNKHINEGWVLRTSLNDLSIKEMSEALNFGYELEKTPEEELLEFYLLETNNSVFENGVNLGIKFTLDKLNIKIKGINA